MRKGAVSRVVFKDRQGVDQHIFLCILQVPIWYYFIATFIQRERRQLELAF